MKDKPQVPALQPDESPSEILEAAAIAAYLETHPDFFVDHEELLPALRIPHQRGYTVSLVERQMTILRDLSSNQMIATELAGEPILAKLTAAPGNGASFGGVKVTAENGWFAARPSGTEAVYKLYAESFVDRAHLARIQEEARALVARLFAA